MTALVQGDRREGRGFARGRLGVLTLAEVEVLPGPLGPVVNRRGDEGVSTRPAEHEVVATPAGALQARLTVAPQQRQHRNRAATGTGLRLDRAFLLVPTELDADQVRFEVQIAAAESLQLPTPQARVERRGPDRPVLGSKRGQERRRFRRRGDPRRALRRAVWKVDSLDWVEGLFVAVNGSTAERLDGIEDVAHGPHRKTQRKQFVREALEIAALHVADLKVADRRRRNMNPHRSVVRANRVRLVALPPLRSDRPRSHPVDKLREGLRQGPGIASRPTQPAASCGAQRVHSPSLRFRLAPEGLTDLPLLPR